MHLSLTKPDGRSASEDASDTELKHVLTLTKTDGRSASEDTSEDEAQGQRTLTHMQHTHMHALHKQYIGGHDMCHALVFTVHALTLQTLDTLEFARNRNGLLG